MRGPEDAIGHRPTIRVGLKSAETTRKPEPETAVPRNFEASFVMSVSDMFQLHAHAAVYGVFRRFARWRLCAQADENVTGKLLHDGVRLGCRQFPELKPNDRPAGSDGNQRSIRQYLEHVRLFGNVCPFQQTDLNAVVIAEQGINSAFHISFQP
ncbi:hypothetical protein D1872_235150 [compost metagenome]